MGPCSFLGNETTINDTGVGFYLVMIHSSYRVSKVVAFVNTAPKFYTSS